MSSITITIPDDQLAKLEKIAARFGVSAEDLVRYSIDDLLAKPEQAFEQAAQYVLDKNRDLYQRLA